MPGRGSFHELGQQGQQLVQLFAAAVPQVVGHTGADVLTQQLLRKAVQCSVHRRYLHQNIGAQTTMTLVPQVADAVQIPVIAAGGIADGRGMAAAFMLGAEGVQMGTRFVVAKESIVHPNYKERVIKAKDIDSEVTGMSTGHPIRVLRNQMSREYLKMEKEGASFEELEHLTLGSLRKAVIDGDVVNGSLMAGQSAGMVKKEESCKEIIEDVVTQAESLLGR